MVLEIPLFLSVSFLVVFPIFAGSFFFPVSLPRGLGAHDPVATQVLAYVTLVVLLAVEIVFLVRRREWGRLRPPALAACLAASVLATTTLRPELLTTSADWAFGTVGWLGVVLLFNRPLWELTAFLAAHAAVTVARALTLPPLDQDFVLNLVAGAIGTIGFPLACGIASTALRGVAVRAERAATEAAAGRTTDAVQRRLHETRTARLHRLDTTTEPLLAGLADGRLSPDDPDVRSACAVEASRIRRLLAETDLVDDPLMHELHTGVDVAEQRKVLIELRTAGSWAVPDRAVRRALLDGPLAVLSTARTWAQVSVIGTADTVSVGVVADGAVWAVRPSTHDAVEHRVDTDDEGVWVEARWTVPPG